MAGRLSVFRIIAGSFEYPWRHRAAFARATAIPALAMIACTLVWDFAARSGGGAVLAWLLYGAYIAMCSWIAVVSHRLVLIGPADGNAFAGSSGSTRLLVFLAAVIGIAVVYYAALLGLANLLATVLGWNYTPAGTPPRPPIYFDWLMLVSQLASSYVSARLALTLPAIATDQGFSFRQAWIHSRRNGWRLALVVFGLPWLLARLAELLSRDGATPVETALLLVLGVVLLVIEVVALSLSFYDLTAQPPGTPPTHPPV